MWGVGNANERVNAAKMRDKKQKKRTDTRYLVTQDSWNFIYFNLDRTPPFVLNKLLSQNRQKGARVKPRAALRPPRLASRFVFAMHLGGRASLPAARGGG